MRRATRSTWIVAGVIFAAALLLGPLSLLAIGLHVGEGFFVGLLMAVLPVPFYVAFALWVDRFEAEPPWLLVLAFVWGAAIATFFSMIFNLVFAAAFTEELMKGAALLLLFLWKRDHFDNVTDGIVYASMVGLGFAMTENIQYYGAAVAQEGAAITFFLRGVMGPFAHPLFTSMTGIGLGLARETHRPAVRWLAPLFGILAAIILHSLWNIAASYGFAFFAAYAVVMVPAFLAVIVIAIFSLEREASLIRTHLQSVVAEGVLSGDDIVVLSSVTHRFRVSAKALFTRGYRHWRARRRFHALATELAFHSWRASREATEDAQAIHAELRQAVSSARAAQINPSA